MNKILQFKNNPWKTDYHVHTSDWSDGQNTTEEMVTKAIEIGLEKLIITDHCTTNDTTSYNKDRDGNKQDPIAREIKQNYTNLNLDFGVEADILDEKGNMCCDIQGEYFDFKVLSLHGSTYVGDPKKVTEGIINAIKKHRNINIIGHPYEFHLGQMDVELIVAYANKYNIGVEFNCKSVLNGKANMDGVMTVLNKTKHLYFTTDAHSVDALEKDRIKGLQFLKDECFEIIPYGGQR